MRPTLFPVITVLMAFTLLLSLSGCTSYDFSRRYVQQGNLINETKIARLKLGMSKEDCSILMGTALLSPVFDSNRWDYVYTWRDGGNQLVSRPLVLYFANGRLIKIEKPELSKKPKPATSYFSLGRFKNS